MEVEIYKYSVLTLHILSFEPEAHIIVTVNVS